MERFSAAGLRSIIVKIVKEDYFLNSDISPTNRAILQEKHSALLKNIHGFIGICNYTTGEYEYVSEGVKDHLGYDVSTYSVGELTNFVFSIIHENHSKFMLNLLLPTVLKYFKENATIVNGLDYSYTCCVKLKNIYDIYEWYLIDTSIIQVDRNGFPIRTLITCTNINQIKRDECVYYSIKKKNSDGVYEVMLQSAENNQLDEYKLTPRELQIINLIAQGYANKQIAGKLLITIHTVHTHRKKILRKIQCRGTAELTNFAFSRGLL